MPFSNIVIVFTLILSNNVFLDKKEAPSSIPTQYELNKKSAAQYSKGCKTFDRLSDIERKRYLSYQTKAEFCMNAFFSENSLGLPSEFLSAQKLKQFENHLKNDQCKQAEQILWQSYKKRYPKAPPANFQRKQDYLRGLWQALILQNSSPDTLFCRMKNEFETAQKIIEEKKLQTTPITNLKRVYNIKTQSEVGKDRRVALYFLYILICSDHQAAQLYVIDQTVSNQALMLDIEPLYFLLKRLDIKGHLPEKYETLLKTTKETLNNKQRQRIEKEAAKPKISLLLDFPVRQKNI